MFTVTNKGRLNPNPLCLLYVLAMISCHKERHLTIMRSTTEPSSVDNLPVRIFVAFVALYVRMFVARANMVEGTMG